MERSVGTLGLRSVHAAVERNGSRPLCKPLREIVRELGVDTIIEGSVLRAGPRVRITAQLINSHKEETHLRAESYERGLNDILALQGPQAIAREVQVTTDTTRTSPPGVSTSGRARGV